MISGGAEPSCPENLYLFFIQIKYLGEKGNVSISMQTFGDDALEGRPFHFRVV